MTSFAPLDHDVPLPVRPDPRIDREPSTRRRPRIDRIATQPNRERRVGLDGLAIGAPLTAAFVGVLLAEADLAAGHDAGVADASVTPVRAGGIFGSALQPTGTTTAVATARADGATSLASGTTSGGTSAIDPVVATDPGTPPKSGSGGGGEGAEPAPLGQASAMATNAAVAGSITLNFGGAGAGGVGAGAAGDGDGDDTSSGNGTIGGYVTGGDGDDVIHGTPYDDHLSGGPGDDTIYGYAGDDELFGEAGNDSLYGGEGDDLLDGGIGDDQLFGGPGDDRLLGADGDDQLRGEVGSDWLDGGAGDDFVDGGANNDRLMGGTGNDELVVDDIHDIALEYDRGADGGGIDRQRVDAGFADTLPQGTDAATFVFSENLGTGLPEGAAPYRQQVGLQIEHLTLEGIADHGVIGDSGNNELIGNAGDNVLYGGAGDDILAGNDGRDLLDGGPGADRLDGGADDDILRGGEGSDEIHGGTGDDVLSGGLGADQLYGEGGDDTYVLNFQDSAIDTIYDYEGVNQLSFDRPDGTLLQTGLVGDDLHVVANNATVAVIDDYVGNEDNWAGIDLGEGVVGFDGLMADNADGSSSRESSDTEDGEEIASSDDDLLEPYLTARSGIGTDGADEMAGSTRADWLAGLGGDDHLQGGEGHDVLEGGDGSDLLEGGAGDDRYLFKTAQNGFDTIRDGEGVNMAELQGFEGDMAVARVIDGNLLVAVDYAPIFTVENFADNPESFAGIQLGDTFHSTQDLLA